MDIESKFPIDHARTLEFEAASASRSETKLELFIQRHPRTKLAQKAAQLVRRIRQEQSSKIPGRVS